MILSVKLLINLPLASKLRKASILASISDFSVGAMRIVFCDHTTPHRSRSRHNGGEAALHIVYVCRAGDDEGNG